MEDYLEEAMKTFFEECEKEPNTDRELFFEINKEELNSDSNFQK